MASVRKRGGAIIVALLVLAVICIAIIRVYGTRERPLLARATRIADISHWGVIHHGYYWLSDQTILCFNVRQGDAPVLYHLDTRSYTPLSALQKHLEQADGRWFERLSPDGHWLMWETNRGHQVEAAMLDGSHHHVWEQSWNGSVVWMEDSLHWLGVNTLYDVKGEQQVGQKVFLGNIDSDQSPRSFPVDSEVPLPPDRAFTEQRCLEVDVSQLGLSSVTIREYSLHDYPASLRSHLVQAPLQGEIWGYEINRNGEWIAWQVSTETVPPLPEAVRHLLHIEPHKRHSFWISRSDGSQMHEIGYVDELPEENGSVPIKAFNWMPDGKHLSFVLRHSLWTVPVD